MKVRPVSLRGLILFEPKVHGDRRGYFQETWNQRAYAEHGLEADFVQDNLAFSHRGVLRGLHFQNPHAQGKFIYVLEGEVFDVAVDLRVSSPTFGQRFEILLSADNRLQLYVPPGFAHGYQVTSETALFAYKCTDFYSPETQYSILWNDPAIGVQWPLPNPVLAPKDREAPILAAIPRHLLFP